MTEGVGWFRFVPSSPLCTGLYPAICPGLLVCVAYHNRHSSPLSFSWLQAVEQTGEWGPSDTACPQGFLRPSLEGRSFWILVISSNSRPLYIFLRYWKSKFWRATELCPWPSSLSFFIDLVVFLLLGCKSLASRHFDLSCLCLYLLCPEQSLDII